MTSSTDATPDRFAAVLFPAVVVGTTFVVDAGIPRGMDVPRVILLSAVVAVGLVLWAGAGLRSGQGVRVSLVDGLLVAGVGSLALARPGAASAPHLELVLGAGALTALTFLTRQITTPADGGPPAGADDLAHTLWISGGILALLGLRQALDAGAFQFADGGIKTPIMGTLGTANGFGAMVALGAAAALVTAERLETVGARRLMLAAALVCLFALGGNGSRGALLGVVVGLATFAVLRADTRDGSLVHRLRRHPWALRVGAAVLALAVAGGLVALDPGSAGGRLLVWRIAAPMALDHPLTGVGAGGFSAAFQEYQARFFSDPSHLAWSHKATFLTHPHSDWLRPFLETGWLGGLVATLPWILALWAFAAATLRSTGTARNRWAALLTLALVVAVHGTVDTIRLVVPVAVAGHLLLGFAPAPERRWVPGPVGRATVLAVAVAASGWAVATGTRIYRGQEAWMDGLRAEGATSPQRLREALLLLPGEPALEADLGRALLAAGSPDEGVAQLEAAVAAGASPDLRLTLAETHLAMDAPDAAEAEARAFLAAFPDRIRPRLLVARARLALGDEEAAREELARCIRRETRIRSAAVEAVAAEAEALWRSRFDDPPPIGVEPAPPSTGREAR